MDKLCINCATENPADAVFCSECGMSLTNAPTGEEALKLKAEMDGKAESPMRAVGDSAEREAKPLLIVGCIVLFLWPFLIGAVGFGYATMLFVLAESATHDVWRREYSASARNTFLGTSALALAPWVIVFIVLGVRWWRSRASEGPEHTEQNAA